VDVEFVKGWLSDYFLVKNTGSNQSKVVNRKQIWLENDPRTDDVREQLREEYNSGIGFKRLSVTLGTSYTKLRRIFLYLGIEHRRGRNIVTNKLREIRSENVRGHKSPWYNWTEKYPHLAKNSKTGLQGYYKRKNGEYVWLRSCWEYIYAKWLDKNDKIWEYETRTYHFEDFSYRPDFIVFGNEDWYIVEVKSNYYGVRRDKIQRLKEYISEEKVIVINNIEEYTNNSYAKELRKWKKERLSKEDLEKRLK
jgi:hypothetical protein